MEGAGLYGLDERDREDEMLLEPPDPVDLLIASTADDDRSAQRTRPLDFVRSKLQDLKRENKQLRERVADLEQTLSIVQTAQEWTLGKGISPEKAEKMREIQALLEQAKKAKEEIQSFSTASKQALFEKLKLSKNALKKERQEKELMKGRLLHAMDFAKSVKELNRQLQEERQQENDKWQAYVQDMKDRNKRKILRLQGDSGAQEADRHDHLKDFGEQVMGDLSALQQHLKEIRQETIDNVVMEGDEYFAETAATAGAAGDAGDPDADVPFAEPPGEPSTESRGIGEGTENSFLDSTEFD